MKKMAQKIPGAEFTVIPSAGHLAPMGNPDAFNHAVLNFLARHVYKNDNNQARTIN